MGVKKGSIRGPYKRRERPFKRVISCSFGKDSIATVLLAKEMGIPIDYVVFVEVMYDGVSGISGEVPIHIDWVKSVGIPMLRDLGFNVVHLVGDDDYLSIFNRQIRSGRGVGKINGFPLASRCYVQRECKLRPIRRFYKDEIFSQGYDVLEYVGIAIDEPTRIVSLEKSYSPKVKKDSLLVRYGYTETMSLLKCQEYGLLSPIYTSGVGRNGCWFCPNQGISSFYKFRIDYPDMWQYLRDLSLVDNRASVFFKYDKTVDDIDKMIDEYEAKYGKYYNLLGNNNVDYEKGVN